MPNKPRANNPHRSVRVENDLWQAAGEVAKEQGTTRAAIIQEALRQYVRLHSAEARPAIRPKGYPKIIGTPPH